jgi:hypothetical protein
MLRFLPRTLSLAFLLIPSLLAPPSALWATDLEPRTLEAFMRYVRAAEARMAAQQNDPGRFLYIDTLPDSDRRRAWAAIRRGEVWVDSPEARDAKGTTIRAPAGLINHWLGAMFIPRASLQQVLVVIEDYEHYKDLYKPEIVRSRLLSREGNDFKTFMRVRKKTPWVTVTLNINSEIIYRQPDPAHIMTRSQSTRIAQVEDADMPQEHEYTPGRDSGYLWRIETYWRMEELEGGVAAEWESITLSRDIPWLLRWIVRPFVERLARSTVQDTLTTTRRAAGSKKSGVLRQPQGARWNQDLCTSVSLENSGFGAGAMAASPACFPATESKPFSSTSSASSSRASRLWIR